MAIELNKENLESSLSSGTATTDKSLEKNEMPEISKEEEIGVHKGSLNTLAAERMELVKMLQNVETIMQAHLKRLEELGVKIESKGE
jgi:hypothetical protein